MKVINVDGVPPDIVEHLKSIAERWRNQTERCAEAQKRPLPKFRSWPSKVLAQLTRDEIYGDLRI